MERFIEIASYYAGLFPWGELLEAIIVSVVIGILFVAAREYAARSAKEDSDEYLDDLAKKNGLSSKEELQKALRESNRNRR